MHAEGVSATHGGAFTLSQAGTVSALFAYMQIPSGVEVQCAVYNDSNVAFVAATETVTGTGAPAGWVQFNFSGNGLQLSAGSYQLLWNASGSYTAYDSGSTGGTPVNSATETFGTWPNPGTWSHASSTLDWCIYGSYTANSSAGVILDGQAITVEKWSEDTVAQGSNWDSWSGGQYKRKVKTYGIVRTYTLVFLEYNVTWGNSLANQYQLDALNGNVVTFYSDLAVRPVSSVSVYVLDVQFDMENLAGQNVRVVTVTIQEA
jgi:hypothetical protein